MNTTLTAIFLTGLFTGGLTCLAVQGGLLAASVAQRSLLKNQVQEGKALPVLVFLLAKLFAYTLLGFLLGWLGSVVQVSLTATIILQVAVVIFMLGTALDLLEVHPIFRYFVLQPPKFLTRFIHKESKSSSLFAPAVLGFFTVFIPCGTTQAIMALAIASGSPFVGATMLFVFTLGTSPVFFTVGYLATRIGDAIHSAFMQVAALVLILLAVYNLNGAIALTGSSVTLETLAIDAYCVVAYCDSPSPSIAATAVKDANITIDNNGYSPNFLTVKAGSQVTLHLKNVGGTGCTQALTIPSLNIQKVVSLGQSDNLTFTAPNKPGSKITFMCSAGHYPGVINVI